MLNKYEWFNLTKIVYFNKNCLFLCTMYKFVSYFSFIFALDYDV